MDPFAIIAGVGGTISLLIILATAYAIFKSQVKKSDMEILQASNNELRAQRDDMRSEIDVLKGQVQTLQSSLAQDLARSIKNEIAALVTELREQTNDRT